MKKLALLAAVVAVVSLLPGCGLIFLPCSVCLACANAGTPSSATDEPQAFAEVGPSSHFQTDALTAAVAH